MRKLAIIAAIGLFLVGLFWWIAQGMDGKVDPSVKVPLKRPSTAMKPPARQLAPAVDPVRPSSARRPILAPSTFLDSICPSLSPAEENQILAKYDRSVRCLVGLALLKTPPNRDYLEEALRNFPDDHLVNYVLINTNYPGFDAKRAAQAMESMFPDSALPFLILAKEAFESRAGLVSGFLKQAAGKNDQFPFQTAVRELKEEMLASAGRDVDAIRTRMNLDVSVEPQIVVLGILGGKLGIQSPSFPPTEQTRELLPALLSLYQNISLNESASILDRAGATTSERVLLRTMYNIYRDDAPEGMFTAPLSQLVKEAEAEEGAVGMLSEFGYDKTSLYQRIPPEQQQEFNRLIGQQGELAAFRWLLRTNPDVFIDPEYPPSSPNGDGGPPKEVWEQVRFTWLKRATGS